MGRDRRARAQGRRRARTPATCASRWAASPRSSPSTIPTATSGTPPRSVRTRRSSRPISHRRLREEYAPKGLVHFGQGKWYPGEPLPRWALNLYWRRDGEPLWKRRLARRRRGRAERRRRGARAAASCAASPRELGLDPEHVFPAYEDAYYYLWRERRLPVNVDPHDAKLDDPLERDRLRRLFTVGLDKVVGHVLPIAKPSTATLADRARGTSAASTASSSPATRRIGLRLPLDSQPWVPREQARARWATFGSPWRASTRLTADESCESRAPRCAPSRATACSTSSCRRPTRSTTTSRSSPRSRRPPPRSRVPGAARGLYAAARPSARPPQRHARPRRHRGEHPARRRRGTSSSPTRRTSTRPRASRASPPRSSRSTVATSGPAAAITWCSAASTPDESPFLRRPDLLRSLIAYFHQHPSLSFLFSGQFIGPTSQAPRIDEARNDSVFEIEIAFREVTRKLARARRARSRRRGSSIASSAISSST